MANSSSNWQNAIDSQLVGRLILPLTQAGLMKMDMSQKIIDRTDRFLNRLPLLSQQMQRWGNVNTLSSSAIPIVYARPISRAVTRESGINSREDQLVVQQITPNNLSTTAEIPLQAKFVSSEGISSVSSPLIAAPTTQTSTDSKSELQETNIPVSEYSLVSPQAIANHSSTIDEMPLKAKSTSSEGVFSPSSPLIVDPIPLIISSSTDGVQEISISESSGYPIVLSKVRVNDLSMVQEMPLAKNNSEVSEELHLIAQAKSSNSAVSSSLPVVSRLNTLVSSSQPQSDTNLSNIRTNHWENLTAQIFSTTNPITTAIATTPSQAPQDDPVIREKTLSSTLSNQQDYPLPIVKPKSSAEANMLNVKNKGDRIANNPNPLPVVSLSPPINPLKFSQSYPLTPNSLVPRDSPNRSRLLQEASEEEGTKLQVFASPSPPMETIVSSMSNQPKIDVDAIASQVERKLMRRLVVESERRGQKR